MQQYGRHDRGGYVRPAAEHPDASGNYADWARQSCRGPFGRPSIRHWRNKWVFAIECERGVRHPQRHLVYQHGNNDNGPAGGWRQFPRRQDIRCRRQHGFLRRFDRCKRGVHTLIHGESLSNARGTLSAPRQLVNPWWRGISSPPIFLRSVRTYEVRRGDSLAHCRAYSAGLASLWRFLPTTSYYLLEE